MIRSGIRREYLKTKFCCTYRNYFDALLLDGETVLNKGVFMINNVKND